MATVEPTKRSQIGSEIPRLDQVQTDMERFLVTEKTSVLIIVISILFAAAILLSSYVLDGTPYEQTAIYTLIAAWLISSSVLCKKRATAKSDDNRP